MHRDIDILGVQVRDASMDEAVALLGETIEHGRASGRTHAVYFVNAHTLNCSHDVEGYREVLNRADLVFGDGTGVRWAARMGGVRLQDNLNGTDMTPELFRRYAGQGYRYFLLGSTSELVEQAADGFITDVAPGWTLAGAHHGYVDDVDEDQLIQQINEARPDVLLVGMGNPLQEQWIHRHRDALRVPLVMAIGGLFHYIADDVPRAAKWVRDLGMEWVHVLLQQPKKARRYLLGNPIFLWRAMTYRLSNGPAVQRLPVGR